MAKGSIRVIGAIPGPASRDAIVRDFCRRSEGVVTAFSDACLPQLKALVPEDTWIEVKPFGELVRSCLELAGEEAFAIAQGAHYQSAIAAACEAVPEDSPFARAKDFSGFHQAMADTLKELRMWAIDSDTLTELADQASDHLAPKLRSMAKIGATAETWLAELGRQLHADHLQRSLNTLPERDGSLDHLLVFAGSEFSPLRLRWLNWISQAGVAVTVVFDRDDANADLFQGSRAAQALLGHPITPVGTGNLLQRRLFGDKTAEGAPLDAGIVQVTAPDVLYEVEWALREAARLGTPSRTAIVCRDLEQYGPLIDASSRRLAVPVVMLRREPLLANAFARLTLAALEFCLTSDVREVMPIARSSYLGLDLAQRQRLWGAARDAHRARHDVWPQFASWVNAQEDHFDWLKRLLVWREEARSTQDRFAGWCGRLREFIGQLPWAEIRDDRPAIEPRDVYAQNALVRALSAYASVDQVAHDREIGLREFTATARKLWEEADVSVPRADEGITVAANIDSLPDIDHLIVMGMLEGTFPKRRSEDPILTDEDRAELSALRPDEPPLENSFDASAAERDQFYRVCSAPRRRLVLSYPLTSDESDNVPAFYLGEVDRAAPDTQHIVYTRDDITPSTEGCSLEADRKLHAAIVSQRTPPQRVQLETEEARAAIRLGTNEAITPEQLSDAARCPFQFSARHRLGIRPGRPYARWYGLRNLPLAAKLATQPNLDLARAALESALESHLDELYADVPSWELRLLKSGGYRLIDDWIAREATMREHFPKSRVSTGIAFGTEGFATNVHPGLTLTGTVPAVSETNDYRIVHLYSVSLDDLEKLRATGERTPSLDQVDAGLRPTRLLIGLYMLSAYNDAKPLAIEVDTGKQVRTLAVLQRPIQAAPMPPAAFLSIIDLAEKSRHDGHWQSTQIEFTKATKAILRDVLISLQEARMLPTPGDAACRFCEYGELCRRSVEFGEIEEESLDE